MNGNRKFINHIINNPSSFNLTALEDQLADRGFKVDRNAKTVLVLEAETGPRHHQEVIFTAQTNGKPVTADTLYEYPKNKFAPIQDAYRNFIRAIPEPEGDIRLFLKVVQVENGKSKSGSFTSTTVKEEKDRVEHLGTYPERETKIFDEKQFERKGPSYEKE